MIETVFFVPAIFLLLFVCVDLARFVQLSEQADRAADMLVNQLSALNILDEEAFTDAVLAADRMISAPANVSISVAGIHLSADQTETLLWSRSGSSGDSTCTLVGPDLAMSDLDEDTRAPTNYFFQVAVCVEPSSDFFVSGLLSFLNLTVRGEVLSIAPSPTIRALE
jgi:hypothetical protein